MEANTAKNKLVNNSKRINKVKINKLENLILNFYRIRLISFYVKKIFKACSLYLL